MLKKINSHGEFEDFYHAALRELKTCKFLGNQNDVVRHLLDAVIDAVWDQDKNALKTAKQRLTEHFVDQNNTPNLAQAMVSSTAAAIDKAFRRQITSHHY